MKNIIKSKIDLRLLFYLLILIALGTMMIFSASYPYALAHYEDGYYYIKRHGIFLFLGIGAMIGCSKIKMQWIQKITPVLYGIGMALLVAVLIGGFSEGIAKRWLGIPGTPLSFQPSELMKFFIVIMLAWYIDKNQKKTLFYQVILPGIILFSACGLVLLEKHLSGTLIIAFIGLCVIFLSGIDIKKMIFVYGLTALAGGVVFLLTNSYAMKRIESFLNPNADVLSDKWQTTQGLYAIGSGGIFGLGFSQSRQKYSYVSEPQNDFIFTIWCEEMGFVGAILLIALFVLFIFRGYAIAIKSPDRFSSLTAFGIVSQIAIQTVLNMCVVTDLIPNTGISLPFFSYGGSSFVILMAEMGILLSISKQSKLRRKDL